MPFHFSFNLIYDMYTVGQPSLYNLLKGSSQKTSGVIELFLLLGF